jgi:hypothetical protein
MAGADAETQGLLYALINCVTSYCPPGSADSCATDNCTAEFDECGGGDSGPTFSVHGMMVPMGFGYVSIGDASLIAFGAGWDGNWLAGPPTSAADYNVGIGLNANMVMGEDLVIAPSGYVYFHYFFPNDLTDSVWTFFGLGLQLEAGATVEDGMPFFVPQGLVAFRWLSPFTLNIEGFVGPELAFPDSVEVGFVAGLRVSFGFILVS